MSSSLPPAAPLVTTPMLVPAKRLSPTYGAFKILKGVCLSGGLPSTSAIPGLIIKTKLLQQLTVLFSGWMQLPLLSRARHTKKNGSPAAPIEGGKLLAEEPLLL